MVEKREKRKRKRNMLDLKTIFLVFALLGSAVVIGAYPTLIKRLPMEKKMKIAEKVNMALSATLVITIISILTAIGVFVSMTAYYVGGLLLEYAVVTHSYFYPIFIYIGGVIAISILALDAFVDLAFVGFNHRDKICAFFLVGSAIVGTLWSLISPNYYWGNSIFFFLTKNHTNLFGFFVLSIFGIFYLIITALMNVSDVLYFKEFTKNSKEKER